MSKRENICLSGNNSTLQATGKSSDMDYMTSLQIAEITGKQHKDVLEAIRNMEPAWVKTTGRKFPLNEYKDARGRKLPMYRLAKTECLYIATKFNDEARAKLVLRWEELESSKAEPMVKAQAPKQISLRDGLAWVKEVKKLLNLNDASTLGLLQKVGEPLGLPLPDYTPSKGILRSATYLLKENGSPMTVQQFNALMVQHGLLVELTRPSGYGGVRKFKNIVGDGLTYGENQVHPNFPNGTQPLYYADKFGELLTAIGRKEATL